MSIRRRLSAVDFIRKCRRDGWATVNIIHALNKEQYPLPERLKEKGYREWNVVTVVLAEGPSLNWPKMS